ncbi:MAG: 50S ribosomal protein L21 [Candidatus Dormibacteraeota bacterium]|uniref:Large ribosomal subunit protein bL21 n=1 Tax=Candidatus Amunia macphersoniae TaxID=3127014 RepID=A0A934KQU1_9BACT|nr:50S ribosomal protein L21 [Candidatus Dormibacteraeota bacterium]
MYAILSHGGRQYRVSAGDRLLVDRLAAEVGSVVALEPVLLTGGDGETGLGRDVDGVRVAATVIAHRRGEKLRIFKYKAKKRYRRAAGYRSDLTELRVHSILAKGAAIPAAGQAAAGDSADTVAATSIATRRASAKAPVAEGESDEANDADAGQNAGETEATAQAAQPAAKGARIKAAPTPAANAKGAGDAAEQKETGDGA